MVDYVAFGLIIDDIVYPDGRTAMGVLGGGGPQTALGMRLWSDSVGLLSGVGSDLPAEIDAWFELSGIDRAGVFPTAAPTLRAWQILEDDGRRTQVWRVPGAAIGAQLARSFVLLPEAYRAARGFHYGVHPDEPDLAFAVELRARQKTVSLEPFKAAETPPSREALETMLTAAGIFSPNLFEAVSLLGPGEPEALARRMIDAGAQVVALRLGSAGSLVMDAAGQVIKAPAVPARFVDPIGAGNAYCGGFLVGWQETQDPAIAAAYGAVAGSFLGEQPGTPACTAALRQEARRRLADLTPLISRS